MDHWLKIKSVFTEIARKSSTWTLHASSSSCALACAFSSYATAKIKRIVSLVAGIPRRGYKRMRDIREKIRTDKFREVYKQDNEKSNKSDPYYRIYLCNAGSCIV